MITLNQLRSDEIIDYNCIIAKNWNMEKIYFVERNFTSSYLSCENECLDLLRGSGLFWHIFDCKPKMNTSIIVKLKWKTRSSAKAVKTFPFFILSSNIFIKFRLASVNYHSTNDSNVCACKRHGVFRLSIPRVHCVLGLY